MAAPNRWRFPDLRGLVPDRLYTALKRLENAFNQLAAGGIDAVAASLVQPGTFAAGDFTVAGALTVQTVRTGTGTTASTASGTPVTLFTATAGTGAYVLTARTIGDAATVTSLFSHNGSGWIGATLLTNGALALSVSGNDIRATQTSGAPHTIAYVYTRLA